MKTKLKLSPAQADLLRAMQAGTRVFWIDGLDCYYCRGDTYDRCTSTVLALINRGLLSNARKGYGRSSLNLTSEGKSLLA